MKITHEGRPPAVMNSTNLAGNPVLPNPDSAPDDPVDVALDAEATVPVTPAASIGIVQAVSGSNELTDTTLVIAPPVPGNILVCVQAIRSSKTPLGPLGWTPHPDGVSMALPPVDWPVAMFWKVAGPSEPTSITARISAGERNLAAIIEIEGAPNLIATDALPDQNGASISIGLALGVNPAIVVGGFNVKTPDAGSYNVTPDGDTTEQADLETGSGFSPLLWLATRIVPSPASGTFGVGGTVSTTGRDWAAQALAFDDGSGDHVFIPAPEVVDDDDATYAESTDADGLHIDLGGANVLSSVRVLIGSSTSGSKTYDLYGANEEDYSDEVLVATKTFTATGSYTPDDETLAVTDPTAYRYWRFNGPTNTRRWFTVEMIAAPTTIVLDGYQPTSEKGEPNGYVPLDGDGLIPTEFLPPGSGVVGAVFSIVFVVDGGGAAIASDAEVDVIVPADGTLLSWTMLADISGSAVVDVWSDVYGSYPPTDADSITAAAPPTLTTATKATDATLTGWDKTLTAGDILRFHVDSASTITRLELTLLYERT